MDCLKYARQHNYRRIEATSAAAQAWRTQIDELAERTLFSQADSWYMGANIPGKHRQLLNYPAVQDYLRRIRETARAGYPGFVFS